MKLAFEWTDEKARYLLRHEYRKSYLKGLNGYELFNLGLKEGLWSGKNPFKDEKQEKLNLK